MQAHTLYTVLARHQDKIITWPRRRKSPKVDRASQDDWLMWSYLDLSPGYIANGFWSPKIVGAAYGLALCSGYKRGHKQQARRPMISNDRMISLRGIL